MTRLAFNFLWKLNLKTQFKIEFFLLFHEGRLVHWPTHDACIELSIK